MPETELYLFWKPDHESEEKLRSDELSGVVIEADSVTPQAVASLAVQRTILEAGDPDCHAPWCEQEGVIWSTENELDEAAARRDRWPHLTWLPRLNLYRPEVGYQFEPHSLGEGFKFYTPDTSAIHAYRTLAGDHALETQLDRAAELGFDRLWIHSIDAELSGNGLDLELLERVARNFGGMLWISGGATDEQHLVNLARQGGASAVVVGPELALRCGCERLNLALESGEERGVPVTFDKPEKILRPG